MADSDLTPKFAPFLGMAGIAFAMIFGCIGAAYGTAKSGIGIAGVGVFRGDLIMKACSKPPLQPTTPSPPPPPELTSPSSPSSP
ncbi:v-type proton ATPase 16 kDa proteolipid subunit 2 [Friedmanniomyces endolithicus]|nr:v-type proton ATPase 16 kDa proteolipid subunit 2 [Friedmanniomyces endolithicus]KAK0786772.1 v-type proton ATPase 16 kDa proteolipid subunit 2 [Friedmanniomyces endolithicus]KAK0791378.1 v-type proton ATPase 16 kDa proteolipid subunit 2 [Friedmanniomyces endolithicus]KAK0848806.1 v-type proton ATPase 16 kDa proteolipid subunit 2 [Friedmanniomyces endolithicus]KAK0858114.1 v-type proton ATPase 16 kDa proteolipid subunit 2 [Friedmanniomyces endolithicus]